jgi:hypothetical protein
LAVRLSLSPSFLSNILPVTDIKSTLQIHTMPTHESLYGPHVEADFVPLEPMQKPDMDSVAMILHSSGMSFAYIPYNH